MKCPSDSAFHASDLRFQADGLSGQREKSRMSMLATSLCKRVLAVGLLGLAAMAEAKASQTARGRCQRRKK